jgi:hypothetical protein
MIIRTEGCADPLHKSRLTSAKLSMERDDITPFKHSGKSARERKGIRF